MPRIVDHERRRQDLAHAVWGLIRAQGVGGVSFGQLTRASGWSSGAIRHYLPTREALLAFAARHVAERVSARLQTLPRGSDPRRNFLALLRELLPLDAERRAESEVWLAFVGLSVSDPRVADEQGMGYRALHDLYLACLTPLGAGGLPGGQTPEDAATELQATVDGLAIHLLLGYITPEQAERTLEGYVGRLLNSET